MAQEMDSILQAVGRTPLIRLQRISSGLLPAIYVKPEFLNPGGSVKDRVGLAMIEAAERDGRLKPGGTIVEATAGNTGAGLAMAAAIKGYHCIFVMPDKMSPDKMNLLRAYGAEVVVTPTAVPPDSAESYNGVADRLAKSIPNAYRPNQFENPNNPLAHYRTTGPEIWEGSGGKIDVLVASMGTGGTISGAGRYLKERNPGITVVGADPEGSILSGDSPKAYKVEGIGEDFIPKTFNRQVVDEMIRVSDKESFNTARRLAREEGILAGGSSGTALAAALKYAQRLSAPKYMVVILPDTGRNYIGKMYSDAWMKENGFWEEETSGPVFVRDLLADKRGLPDLVAVAPGDTAMNALSRMREYRISQVPVMAGDRVEGTVNEEGLMKLLHDGSHLRDQHIAAVMGRPLPVVEESAEVSEAYRLLLSGNPAVLVRRSGKVAGIVTQGDLVNHWIQEQERRNHAV